MTPIHVRALLYLVMCISLCVYRYVCNSSPFATATVSLTKAYVTASADT